MIVSKTDQDLAIQALIHDVENSVNYLKFDTENLGDLLGLIWDTVYPTLDPLQNVNKTSLMRMMKKHKTCWMKIMDSSWPT